MSLASLASLAVPAGASAGVIVPSAPLASGTSGIALGPDGNLWVGEEFNNSVVRVSPTGAVVEPRFTLPGAPRDITAGPDGTVWVTIPSARKIVWFDATVPSPTAHEIVTGGTGTCGPSAITDGGNGKLFFTLPPDGCSPSGRIGTIDAATKALGPSGVGAGTAFDLVVSSGKLFVPDFDTDLVRRFSLGSPPVHEATITAPPGAQPDGITATADGTVWFTMWGLGKVGRFPTTQNLGAATILTPETPLVNPFGITPSAFGGVLVAGRSSANIQRFAADGTTAENVPIGIPGSQPFGLVGTPGGAWAADQGGSRILQLVDAAPNATTGSATATGPTTATLTGSAETGGHDAQLAFEYGTTTAYGATTPPTVAAATASGSSPLSVSIADLAPGTTYHVRARATTVRGTALGADLTFTTPPAPTPAPTPSPTPTPAPPKVAAKATVKSKTKGSTTTITALSVKGLLGGETITVMCAAKKKGLCPFKSKSQRKVKKGTRSLTTYFGKKHPVKVGAKVTITVSATGKTPSTLTLTIRKGKAPLQARAQA